MLLGSKNLSAAQPPSSAPPPSHRGPHKAPPGMAWSAGLCSRHICTRIHAVQHKVPRMSFPLDLAELSDGSTLDAGQMIQMLQPFMTEGRVERIRKVAAERTFSMLPIVEGLYDMGNLAAVCRSADAMGFGAVHCINTSAERYKQSARTSAGAEKWLEVKLWPNGTEEALSAVKAAGYQLVVTHLSKSSVSIQEVDWTRPTAFVLGNEKRGVSEEAVALADHCAVIPMAGFVESFNISVAAALVMYEAHQQRVRKLGRNGDLTPEQQQILQVALMMRSVRQGRTVIKELLDRPPPTWQSGMLKRPRQLTTDETEMSSS